jgi:hypothetical protein
LLLTGCSVIRNSYLLCLLDVKESAASSFVVFFWVKKLTKDVVQFLSRLVWHEHKSKCLFVRRIERCLEMKKAHSKDLLIFRKLEMAKAMNLWVCILPVVYRKTSLRVVLH